MIGRERRQSGSRVLSRITSTLAQTAMPGPVRRATLWILAALGALSFVLGFAGWWHIAHNDPALRGDGVAVLYRTVQMFVGEDGGVFNVPWTLDIARIVAPLVIPLLGSVAILGFAANPLNRLGARTAARHTIAVGPAERVKVHLDASAESQRTEVHADGEVGATLIGPLHVQIDVADGTWLEHTNARAARHVIVATGRDDLNMALLDQALRAGLGCRISVETATAEAQRWLALALAASHPDADVRVMCIEASQRRGVVAQVIGDSRLSVDPAAPCAVVGDAADIAELAVEFARELATAHTEIVMAAHDRDRSIALGTSRHLYVVGAPDPDAVRDALDNHHESIAGFVHLFVGTHTVEEITHLADLVVLVADDDTEQAMRTATQLTASRTDVTVFVRSGDMQSSPLPRLTLIGSRREVMRQGSPDPVWLLTEALHDIENPPGGPHEWAGLHRDLQRRLARETKRIIAALPTAGFCVTVGGSATDTDLPRDDELDAIARVLTGTEPTDASRDEAANLAHVLTRVGLRLTRVASAEMGDSGIDVLAPVEVDRLAELVHALYLDDLRATDRLAEGNTSHVAWHDLPVDLRMQNVQHVVHAVATLNRLGYRLRDPESAAASADLEIDRLADDVVEDWAQREHLRWMTQKLALGWVFGPSDDPEARPPTHPELVAWDSLDASAQDKHRRPIARLVEVLALGGYAVVRPTPPIVIAEAPPIA